MSTTNCARGCTDARRHAVEHGAMQGRGKDVDNVSAHMFRQALKARARILRDRAQAIREGR